LLQRTAVETIGDGRESQAAATLVAGEDSDEEEGSEQGENGLGRFDRPRPKPVGLTSQVGWAWLMGQGPIAIESRIKLLTLFS
jgi:hypothetical protein